MLHRRRPAERRLASWTGSGQLELSGKRAERLGVVDVVISIALCLALDIVALALTVLLTQRNGLIVCGARCFDNPDAHVHDDLVTLWSFGVVVVGCIAFSLVARRARVPVLVVQIAVAAFVLVHTLPNLHTAQHRQEVLRHCQFGAAPPCTGVRDLGPP